MGSEPALVKELLDGLEEGLGKVLDALVALVAVGGGPGAGLAAQHAGQDPVGLDDLALGLRVGVEGGVLAAAAAEGLVADLHGALLGDAVEGVVEGVGRVGADVGAAGGRVVVKDGVGAVGADEVEVARGACCYHFYVAAAVVSANTSRA